MRIKFWVPFVLVISAAAAIIAIWSESQCNISNAEALLRLVQKINIGETRDSRIIQMDDKFRRFMVIPQGGDAEEARMGDLFTFQNHVLAALRLAPRRAVNVGITYKDGRVVSKIAQYVEYDRCALTVEDFGTLLPPESDAQDQSGRRVYLSRDAGSRVVSVVIRDGGAVPESQRQPDWLFDVSQLGSFGKAKDTDKIYPGLFCGS